MLQSTGSKRVRHDLATEQQQKNKLTIESHSVSILFSHLMSQVFNVNFYLVSPKCFRKHKDAYRRVPAFRDLTKQLRRLKVLKQRIIKYSITKEQIKFS